MRPSLSRRALMVVGLALPPLIVAMTDSAFASGAPMASQIAGGADLLAQVQFPIPNFDFDPTKWVQLQRATAVIQ